MARKGSSEAELLLAQEKAIHEAYLQKSADDFMTFTLGIVIDGQTGATQLSRVIRDFQKECFEFIAPNMKQLRDGDMPERRRFWIERTKKASKDADLAVYVAWLVAFPTRPFYIQIGAADRDQAGIVKDRLSALLHHNPWLNDYIKMTGNQIKSTKMGHDGKPLCRVDIKSSDVAGAHGGTPDLLIINELSHIGKFEFAENMMDNADGVAQGMVIIATNAGIKGTKAHKWREAHLASPEWDCFILDRPAPWHAKSTVSDAKRRNSRSRYLRLWWGKWVAGTGDAVDHADIEACKVLKGPDQIPLDGWTYLMGLDLGISKDHAALAVIGIDTKRRKIRVANFCWWNPKDYEDGKVSLARVRQKCIEWGLLYRPLRMLYDPHQAELLVQDVKNYSKNQIRTKEMSFGSASNMVAMADSFVQLVTAHTLEYFDDADFKLQGDFAKFSIVEKQYGLRLEAVRDETGHADVGTAVVITLPAAQELLNSTTNEVDGILVELMDEVDLTDEEVEEMPDLLKEIYEDKAGVAGSSEVTYEDDNIFSKYLS